MEAMGQVHETAINCPYCGESITILVDDSVEQQHYVEDCEVCCRPMDISVRLTVDGLFQLEVRDENE
jgi:transcription elongation factor Elf1